MLVVTNVINVMAACRHDTDHVHQFGIIKKCLVNVSYIFSFCEEFQSHAGEEVTCQILKAPHYEIQCKTYTYLNLYIDKPTTHQYLKIFTHL